MCIYKSQSHWHNKWQSHGSTLRSDHSKPDFVVTEKHAICFSRQGTSLLELFWKKGDPGENATGTHGNISHFFELAYNFQAGLVMDSDSTMQRSSQRSPTVCLFKEAF